MMKGNILLINPWIYDFAAYDLWAKPLGLLYIASLLRRYGYKIDFIDCLYRYHPKIGYLKEKEYGCGKYLSEEVEKPEVIKDFPKRYKRYGIPIEIFKEELSQIEKPDVVILTSLMSYWYLGVIKTIEILREFYKDKIMIILGGVYPTLSPEHAKKNSKADYLIKGDDINRLLEIVFKVTKNNHSIDKEINIFDLLPAYDLYPKLNYVSILTSLGCPYDCSYCASKFLHPKFFQKEPLKVVEEILFFKEEYKISNIAFYDDALLYNSKRHIFKILIEIKKRKIKLNFHTPNGLHLRYIDGELAELLFICGFKRPRLSLESSNEEFQLSTGGKVFNSEFKKAVLNLFKAGYKPFEIETYILTGHPKQRFEDIKESILFAHDQGTKVRLVEYSPLPNTRDWKEILKDYPIFKNEDPILQNNSLMLFQRYEEYQRLKDLVNSLNQRGDRR